MRAFDGVKNPAQGQLPLDRKTRGDSYNLTRRGGLGRKQRGFVPQSVNRKLLYRDDLSYFLFFSARRSDAELMQKRRPVGAGPSGNTWPRWAWQRLQVTSVRAMP